MVKLFQYVLSAVCVIDFKKTISISGIASIVFISWIIAWIYILQDYV